MRYHHFPWEPSWPSRHRMPSSYACSKSISETPITANSEAIAWFETLQMLESSSSRWRNFDSQLTDQRTSCMRAYFWHDELNHLVYRLMSLGFVYSYWTCQRSAWASESESFAAIGSILPLRRWSRDWWWCSQVSGSEISWFRICTRDRCFASFGIDFAKCSRRLSFAFSGERYHSSWRFDHVRGHLSTPWSASLCNPQHS